MLAANAGLLTAIAGVFLFLPALLFARFVPAPEATDGFIASLRELQDYVNRAWLWMLLQTLVNMIGIISIYLVLLARPRLTVGAAVARALPILPFYYLITLIQGAGAGIGLLMLVIGLVFMLGKLVLAGPILVIERPRAPLAAIRDSWRRSAGLGWLIGGLVVILYVAAMFVSMVLQLALGTVILLLAGPQGIGGLLIDVLVAVIGAAVTVIATVLIAAIYRAVSPPVDLAKGAP